MNQSATIKLLSAIAIFAVGFGLGSHLRSCSEATEGGKNGIQTVRVIVHDTTVKEIHHQPEHHYYVKGTSRPQDSNDVRGAGTAVIPDSCEPFVATRQSVFGKDTVDGSYFWPQDLWNVTLRRGPDSVVTVTTRDSSVTYVPVEVHKPWAVSLFAGYAWGVNDLNSSLLAPANIRVGIGVSFNLLQW